MPDTSAAKLPSRSPARFQIPADIAIHAAIVGRTPEIDPTLADPMVAASEARREHPWSPMVLSIYLRQVARQQAMKINKPEIKDWIKKQSLIARRRIAQTQMRINSTHKRAA
jgi:hypothetical protein